MAARSLAAALDTIAGPLRGLRGLTRILAGAAAAVAVFALAAWLARAGWANAPEWVLLAWGIAAALLIGGLIVAHRAMLALDVAAISRHLEEAGGWRRGALTTVLDAPAAGTSAALHAAAASLRANEVAARGAEILGPSIAGQRTRGWRAAAGLGVALAGLVAARPATGAPAQLWHPVGAWRALVSPVRLVARSATVARGEPAILEITAIGHTHATLYMRAPGEAWRTTDVPLDADGKRTLSTPPLAADLVARVEAGGRRSADVHVGVRLAAFLGAFTATAHYPAYLGLEDESLPTTGDTLVLPEGTRLAVAGRATTPLSQARLVGPAGGALLAVDGAAFRGDLLPRENGTWQLRVVPANGGALEGDQPALPIRIVPDSAPRVEVPVPGADTIAATSMSVALVVSIHDDHGVTSAAIESRRGRSGAVVTTALPLPPGSGDRALVTTTLDLAALGLREGDTLRYVATAADNAPARHVGRSREYVIRVPSAAEARALRARETVAAAASFDSLSRQAGRVQQAEEDLARARQRTATSNDATASDDATKEPLASDAARKAAASAQAQQKVIDDATKLQRDVQDLQRTAARNGAADSSLARELGEIDRLLDKALSPELREKLASLRSALKDLDADRTRSAMQDLAQQQAQLKQAMDQARDLFKRAALETDLANMGRDAKQLAAEQHDLNSRLAQHDSGAAARTERELAQRADSLRAGLERAAAQAPSPHSRDDLRQSSEQARAATGKMRQAAQASQAGQAAAAQAAGQQAEDDLNPLSKKIDDDRQNMQAEMRADVMGALTRALEETSRLAGRQLAVAEAFQQGALLAAPRAEQGLIEEGTAKVAQQVTAIASMNALVSPQAGVALASARQAMRDAVDAVASVNPNVRAATDKSADAVDALAIAAFALMQSKDKVNGSQSGSGVAEAMAQMQQMAGKQGQLAQQGAGMMQQGQFSAQQLMQFALQQRALAQQLERMQAGGFLPGAGDLAREAHDLSRTLAGGQLTPDIVQRQQQLFRRMLDAGRSLQGDEDDDQRKRQATTAKDAPPAIPPALDPRIRNGTGDIRLPSWESLQRLSPDERRRVLDYFQRLTQGPKP